MRYQRILKQARKNYFARLEMLERRCRKTERLFEHEKSWNMRALRRTAYDNRVSTLESVLTHDYQQPEEAEMIKHDLKCYLRAKRNMARVIKVWWGMNN